MIYVLLGAIGLLLAGLMELSHYRTGLLPGLIPDTVLGVFLAELGFVAGWAVWVVYRFPLWAGTAVGYHFGGGIGIPLPQVGYHGRARLEALAHRGHLPTLCPVALLVPGSGRAKRSGRRMG
jgi:hypothetical protein